MLPPWVGSRCHRTTAPACVRNGADIPSIRCKDEIIYYMPDDFSTTASCFCSKYFNDSLKCTCKYCVDGSIRHVKFLKVVLAHILGEVSNFCIVSLTVSSWTCLPIFIEIGLYLTDTEQKIGWDVFFLRHCV